MSRLLKLIASVLVLAAGGAVALAAGAAPAQMGSHMIVCPLEPSATITTPCCGPPVATAASAAVVCCGTPQPIACPIGLTAGSSRDPSTAGQKVTISGRWTGGAAGQTVALWQQLPGAKTFTDVAHTTTDSFGDFAFVRKRTQTNRKWYVSVGSEHSATVTQQVHAVVRLTGLHGHVTPNHAGERMLIEERTASAWTVIARPRISRASRFSFDSAHGEVRGVFRGDARNIRTASNVITLP